MPVISVSGTKKSKCVLFRQRAKQLLMDSSELDIKDKRGITCRFLSDAEGDDNPDSAIIIEVIGLFDKPERTPDVKSRLGENLTKLARELFPEVELIQCFVPPFNPETGGFAESRKSA